MPSPTPLPPPPYRFQFAPAVPLPEAEMSLQLALLALEGLYGQAAVRLEARYCLRERARTITVDRSTDVGEDLVRIFTALLIREFGEDSFAVCRVSPTTGAVPEPQSPQPMEAVA